MTRKFWTRLVLIIILAPILTLGSVIALVYWKQQAIVQQLITTANDDFEGLIEISGSHVSPFANFPYISIDLDRIKVYEDKLKSSAPLVDVQDAYLGFDVVKLLSGDMTIKSLKLSNGSIHLVQHRDGSFNIANALSSTKDTMPATAANDENVMLAIKSISIVNIDLTKINEANDILIEAFVNEALAKFESSQKEVMVALDSRFEMNVVTGADTTFVKHKHFDLHTTIRMDQATQLVTIEPSELIVEKAHFKMDGTIDINDDLNLDINFHGNKPNFDLLMAFAPEELGPALERYDNAGKIFFEASIKGKSANGNLPLVVADFGCENAFFNNKLSNKKLDQLYFKGHFTTGEARNLSTMEFSLTDFSARPEAGTFTGQLKVKNFDSPEIDMQIRSDFQLDFLADFLNLQNLQDMKGSVALTMNFHDIVDLARPEKSIEKVNESYYTELEVKDLSFRTSAFHLPISDIDIKAKMDGHAATIDHFSVKVGDSDISLKAFISDLPAILHHTTDPVSATIDLRSSLLDIKSLTSGDTVNSSPFDEQITDLSLRLKFLSSAKAFTESPNFPVGEFFIDNLYARLKHYPHTLHDFHADVYIDDQDFRVVDFTGMIDKSDFHFNGKLRNYDLWFLKEPKGDTRVEFNLTSALLQLEDVFAYGGENYVPEDYRHEEFRDLKIHGLADLHFYKGLRSVDMVLDELKAKMKVHPLKFEDFRGRIHLEDDHLMVHDFKGRLGKSAFTTNLNYYLGPDSIIRKRDNHFSLVANRLDFDELFNYNPPPANSNQPVDHEKGFNIYDLPFSDMTFDFDIKHLNYHRYLIDDFFLKARTTRNHYIHVDTMSLAAAGGKISMRGYFNGSNPDKIYFSPNMKVDGVDLDKLLFKFENFGQDHLVSENLHGKLSGTITGKVHVHRDLVPILDDSEVHMDVQVLDGRLDNYSALHAMADYFKDKNLDRVRFDTLSNKFDMTNGTLTIPAMTINSSVGFIEISGKQDLNLNMEYFVRVPWKLVTQAASQKLFGKEKENVEAEDEIQYREKDKRYRFVNLKLSGTPDNYKISLGKDKTAVAAN